jgi:diguanylate cyclase (GGDEF)-like protein
MPLKQSGPHHRDTQADSVSLPEAFQKQCVLDLADRMRNGLLVYPLIWLVMMQVDAYAGRHLVWVCTQAISLLLLGALRYAFHQRLPYRMERNFIDTRRVFRGLSMIQNAYWGVLCATIMTAPDAPTLRWIMLMSTVGVMAGLTIIVAIDSILPLALPILLLAPTVAMLLPRGGSENIAISGLAVFFLLYSKNLSSLVSKEYWARQRTQALLEQKARELTLISRTDALTGVPNRLDFQEKFTQAWDEAQRCNEPMAIAMVDLDHFKRINDEHGHPFGDRCLQAAAMAITQAVYQPGDTVARFGGEEFVILMPKTDLAGAHAVAQRVLKQLRATLVPLDGHTVKLSCSIGVAACIPSPRDGADHLVQDADQALYVAKHQGRARVECHRPAPVAALAAAT